jgi:hypothetical protein
MLNVSGWLSEVEATNPRYPLLNYRITDYCRYQLIFMTQRYRKAFQIRLQIGKSWLHFGKSWLQIQENWLQIQENLSEPRFLQDF